MRFLGFILATAGLLWVAYAGTCVSALGFYTFVTYSSRNEITPLWVLEFLWGFVGALFSLGWPGLAAIVAGRLLVLAFPERKAQQ